MGVAVHAPRAPPCQSSMVQHAQVCMVWFNSKHVVEEVSGISV